MPIPKKAALGAVLLSLVVGLPVTATADPGDTIQGGCSVHTYADQTLTQAQNTGVIEATAVSLTSRSNPDARASVHCKIQVDDVDAPGTQLDVAANAAGIEQGQQQISYDDQDNTRPWALCEKDDWGDGDTTGWVCRASTIGHTSIGARTSPQAVIDLVNSLGKPCSPGQLVCAALTATTPQGTYSVSTSSGSPGLAAGSIDTYQFVLANGGIVTVPCVVLHLGSTTVDPCATAGGTYVATVATLSNDSASPLATVRVCNANLALTVDGIGVNSFPAYTLC
ncbi:MAG: hypothetical protein QOC82_655 [Frankiaceae bacterium]|jgi:hypothetical protein|nr:hypothetical protein [Frankiaceae bacterium]